MDTQTAGTGGQSGPGTLEGVTWQGRVDRALTTALTADVARQTDEASRRKADAEAFDELRVRFATWITPILETCAQRMQVWGLDAQVNQSLRDTPSRMRRCFDVALRMGKIEDRGPASLTLTAIEGRDLLRVVLRIGPGHIGGDFTEHDGLVDLGDLTEDMLGGLVATLIELLFR